MTTCEVDGIKYQSAPPAYDRGCGGCAGNSNALCQQLGDCEDNESLIIWIKQEQPS